MGTSSRIVCPCGCGEHVTAFDEGFTFTSVSIAACPKLADAGVFYCDIRKSAAYALADAYQAATAAPVLIHGDGLVAFTGWPTDHHTN